MHKLPPLNALRVFEAVARLGGVRQAANELYVTPPAVSHQIAKLEESLGTALFIRKSRNLILTEAGHNYLVEIRPSLEAIGRATSAVSHNNPREVITISAPPTLTSMWLMPRLNDFIAEHPQYDIRLVDRMIFKPEEKGMIDVAIEYRFEADPDLVSKQVLADEVVVITSKEYAEKHSIEKLEDVEGLTLIETERRLTSWRTLLSGYSWLRQQRFISVGYSLHAFEAAAKGLGIAIGNKANLDSMLKSGRLIIPFKLDESAFPNTPLYYLSTTPYKADQPKVKTFMDWIDTQFSAVGKPL